MAGISAGAVGVGQIAPLLDEQIAGAAMLFGGHAAARRVSKPLLLLYGEGDERFTLHIMRFVRHMLSEPQQRLTAVEMPSADHMALVKRSNEVEVAFAAWLAGLSEPVPRGQPSSSTLPSNLPPQ